MKSKTTLQHTCPTEAPFDCLTGDLTGEGFLVVVDKRTHELLIPKERETAETLTVVISPRVAPSVERTDAAAWQAATWRRPADYLREALAELSSAVDVSGFELGEVTLYFDEADREVTVKAELRIEAELLDLSSAADEAMGASRAGHDLEES